MNTASWDLCARCGEPVNPANVMKVRPWTAPTALVLNGWPRVERRLVEPLTLHPGGGLGCLGAVKDRYRAELDEAVGRVCDRLVGGRDFRYSSEDPATRNAEQLPDPFTGAGWMVEADRG